MINHSNVISYENLRNLLIVHTINNEFFIQNEEEKIAELRTVFEDYLSVSGSFDENDEITNKGRIVESLIDKFYVG